MSQTRYRRGVLALRLDLPGEHCAVGQRLQPERLCGTGTEKRLVDERRDEGSERDGEQDIRRVCTAALNV
jgi:hypothetical protein